MIFRILAIFLILMFSNPLFAADQVPQPTPTPPGIMHRMLHPFEKSKKDANNDKIKKKGLDLELNISPDPLKLSQTHEIHVTLVLTNNTGKLVQLDFPTTQRVEVLLRNSSGKVVTQWSENQSFDNDPGYVTINPREHLEYSVTISGRDMAAGQPYTIEGFFPNYENIKSSKTVIPVR